MLCFRIPLQDSGSLCRSKRSYAFFVRSFGCALFYLHSFWGGGGVYKVAEYHFDGIVASIYDDYITDDEEVKALAKKRMAAALGRFHARRQREEYEKWLAEQKKLEDGKENVNE